MLKNGINVIKSFNKEIKRNYINPLLKEKILKALETFKFENNPNNIKIVADEFNKIYEGNVSSEESYRRLEYSNIIPCFRFDIKHDFYTVASHICVPRNGATNILIDAYYEDYSNKKISFLKYQSNTIEETHLLIKKTLKTQCHDKSISVPINADKK